MRGLADFGLTLFDNGYDVIPIRPGHKFPDDNKWRTWKIDRGLIERWIAGKYKNYGVGVKTDHTPMLDVDCYDRDFVLSFIEWCQFNIGLAPVRVGQPPKVGLIYKTDKPFPKIFSKEWRDNHGRKAQLEVLGDGQQFVAEHIHPDTKKPYRWLQGENLRRIKHDELANIVPEAGRRAAAEFDERARAQGWTEYVPNTNRPVMNGHAVALADEFDPFDISSEPLDDLDDEKFAMMAMEIPNDEAFHDRDSWLKFGAAIHHQTGGSEFGRDLWHQWSEQQPQKPGLVDKAWRSFGKRVEAGRKPVTARFIVKLYHEIHVAERGVQIEDIVERMKAATEIGELRSLARECTKLDVDPAEKSIVLGTLREAFKRVTGQMLPLSEARLMIRYSREDADLPAWAKPWVYLSHPDRFFNKETKEQVTAKGFSLIHADKVMQGDDASHYARSALRLPVKYMSAYAPIADPEFEMDGHEYVNTYSEEGVPKPPYRKADRDTRNLIRMQEHFEHLIEDERDIAIFTSWLGWIVRTRDRPNWAIVLQGVEGDGKSMFLSMMGAVLGGRNVKTIHADIALSTPHNTWAEGSMFALVEEIRISGQNRHQTLDKFKPMLTNEVLEINPKGTPIYDCPNTQAYMFTTNYKDALPLNDNDRRYFVMLSRWQSAQKLTEFLSKRPNYYANLRQAILDSPGIIREWLLDYPLHQDFQPKGRAPFSHGRIKMTLHTRSDEAELLDSLIKEGENPFILPHLVISSAFSEAYESEFRIKMSGQAMRITMERAGFEFIGRVKIAGVAERVWVKDLSKWPTTVEARNEAIRNEVKDL